jgi:NADH:ubiquinone oxidoreductase subunit K
MAKHQASDRYPVRDRAAIRTTALAMIGLTLFVIAMIASYSGAFAKPTLHHLDVAVAGPPQLVEALHGQDTLGVTEVADAAAARAQVYDRSADAAFVAEPNGELKIYVAGGGGRSVANAADGVGRAIAAKAGLTPSVEDVAPTSAADPQGTVEFYAVIFLSIGATMGAAVFGLMMGSVRRLSTLALRTLSLAAYSALLAGAVTLYVDGVLGALTSHTWQVFGALWLYAMAVAGAVTGVSAAFGTVASAVVTLFLIIVGNAAAAGPVGLPLLTGFYRTFNAIVPQGSGVALLRSITYFGGNGALSPILTLTTWGAVGLALAVIAVLAPKAWTTYRASHDRYRVRAGGTVLRPRVLSSVD